MMTPVEVLKKELKQIEGEDVYELGLLGLRKKHDELIAALGATDLKIREYEKTAADLRRTIAYLEQNVV